ncbi:MAG TPA: hypothetical protein P5227_07740 [Emcibacteraceae bacterium]|nr:hypothetical protein [Emcibacteraceae bacterium]
MSKSLAKTGLAVAVAAAGLFSVVSGATVSAQEAPQVQCMV